MKERNEDETRRKILSAAAEVFAEEDFFKASVDQVSKKAGVSKGIIFWHFKTKDQLILEVAKTSLPLDVIETCLKEEENTLQCIGNKYLEKYEDPIMRKIFLHTISVMNIYKEISEEIRELCSSMVKKISKCVLNSENDEDIVRIRSFMGGLICYVINPPDIEKKVYVETLVKTVLQ